MREQEELKKLHNDLNTSLNYNTNPTSILASICLIMFDKLNECIDRINEIENSLNEIQKSTNQSKI